MRTVSTLSVGLLLVALSFTCTAASLRVAPTRIDLALDRRAVVLTVTNTGSRSTLLQIESMRWTQSNGDDEYGPAQDLILSPPIFTLDPGADQVVRIARRDAQKPLADEKAYRLFVQEVPTPAGPAAKELNVVLRIGVPVFATPATATESSVQWRLACHDTAAPTLRVMNSGGRAFRIDELSIEAGGKSSVVRAVYVLAGAERLLKLEDLAVSARKVGLQVRSGDRELHASASCD